MERIGLDPGTEVGGYQVVGPLGAGGMGTVYRAVDADGVTVALKLLHPHLTADPAARARLEREVGALRMVRHRGVARVLDAEIDSADAFVVTELVTGTDLTTRVRDRGPLGVGELAGFAEGLRAALAEVHAAGVLHRDLTPGNVMVTGAGPVLIDFGIAQVADDSRVTSVGLVVGTPGYLAPEVLDGAEPARSADWWGWAAVLAFAATGRDPFGSGPAAHARARAGQADLTGLPPAVATALAGALAPDPDSRTPPDRVVTALRAPETAAVTVALGVAAADDDVPVTRAFGVGEVEREAEGDDDVGEWSEGEWSEGEWSGDDEEWPAGEPDEDAWAPPEPARRPGTVLALGAAVVAFGAGRPGVALALAVVLAILVRSVGLSVDAHHRRRHWRGHRPADGVRVAATWPWSLVRAVIGVVPSALVAASAVVIVGGVGWWLVDTGRVVVAPAAAGAEAGGIAGQAAWVTPALLAVAVAVGLVTLWFGPTARGTRTGGRWTLRAIAPGRSGAAVLVLLALALTGVLVTVQVLDPGPTQWWPLPGPPDLR